MLDVTWGAGPSAEWHSCSVRTSDASALQDNFAPIDAHRVAPSFCSLIKSAAETHFLLLPSRASVFFIFIFLQNCTCNYTKQVNPQKLQVFMMTTSSVRHVFPIRGFELMFTWGLSNSCLLTPHLSIYALLIPPLHPRHPKSQSTWATLT